MANYRKVHVKTWKDPDFQELTPEGKLLFMYLFTNESITESGIYPLTIKTVCNETGMDSETVSKLFYNGLPNVIYDFVNHYVFVRNFRKYNPGGKNDLIKKSIKNDYESSKKTKLWQFFNEEYPDFDDLNLQPLFNGNGICICNGIGICICICIEPFDNGLQTVLKPFAGDNKNNNLDSCQTDSKQIDNGLETVGKRIAKKRISLCPYQKILESYHKILPELQKMDLKEWTDTQRGWIKKIWSMDNEHQSLEWFEKFFESIRYMPWLMGEINSDWQASLLWMIKPANFAKIIQGEYLPKNKELKDKLGENGYKTFVALNRWLRVGSG